MGGITENNGWCHPGVKYVGIHWKILSTVCMFGIFPDKHWGKCTARKSPSGLLPAVLCLLGELGACTGGGQPLEPTCQPPLPASCVPCRRVPLHRFWAVSCGRKWECGLQRLSTHSQLSGTFGNCCPLTPPRSCCLISFLRNRWPSHSEQLAVMLSPDRWFGRQLGVYLETELLIQTLGPSPKINSISCCPLLSLSK